MPSACEAMERRSVRGHFHNIEAASIAFCMQCGPNVWLTTLQKRTRSCVCMACVDAPRLPCGFCIRPPAPPSAIPMLSYTLTKITAFSNSRAGLPPGFCDSDCFMCTSVNFDLSPFLSRVCFHFSRLYHRLYISSVCCAAFSLSLAVSSPCTEWLLHCQSSSFWHPCHYFRTVKRLQTYRFTALQACQGQKQG